MIILRKKFSVFCKNCLIKKKLSMILLLRFCFSYLMWCQLIFNNLFFYFLLKTLKHSHTVLKILSELSDIFWDIVIFSFYKIVCFFTNHSSFQNVLNFIFFIRFIRCFCNLKWYDLIATLKYECMKHWMYLHFFK